MPENSVNPHGTAAEQESSRDPALTDTHCAQPQPQQSRNHVHSVWSADEHPHFQGSSTLLGEATQELQAGSQHANPVRFLEDLINFVPTAPILRAISHPALGEEPVKTRSGKGTVHPCNYAAGAPAPAS